MNLGESVFGTRLRKPSRPFFPPLKYANFSARAFALARNLARGGPK